MSSPVWLCPARLLMHLVLWSFGSALGHLLNGSQRFPHLNIPAEAILFSLFLS